MLLSANAKKLMFGYFLGAFMTSVTLGLVIVLALPNSSTATTSRNTLSPALDLALGLIALVVALVLRSGPRHRVQGRIEKRKLAKEMKGPPRWRRVLDKGSPRASFAIGVALSLPGASYPVALDLLNKQELGKGATVAVVVAFCLVMLAIIELPLLGYALPPTGRSMPSSASKLGS